MKQYVLGIDFGTLSGRALLVDVANGQEVATAVHEYANAVITERLPHNGKALDPDTALQDPEDYLEVLKTTIPKVLKMAKVQPEAVIGIGVDFTCCTMLPCTDHGVPLCFLPEFRDNPHAWVKLWKHHAAQAEADFINEVGARRGEEFLRVYGGRYSSEWFFSKLLETVRKAPAIYDAAARFIEAGDWIVWRLTGVEKRSQCAAGYKAMWIYPYGEGWAYPHHDFFKDLHPKLEYVIHDKLRTDLYPLGSLAGGLTAAMAKITGLKVGTPVAVANVDAHAAVPACTVTEAGKMVMIMGTSTCHMLLGKQRHFAEGMCGVVANGIIPEYFGYEAGQSAVGDIFGWFFENAVPQAFHKLAQKQKIDVRDLLEKEAAALKVGESGLLALDWWNGNRSVLVDADLSGVIVGLTLATRPPEIYRALIEATAFGTRKIIEAFTSRGIVVDELYACGGLPERNQLLMQIYADVTGRTIKVAESTQTCALGAAMHGAVAAGHYLTIRAAAAKMARVRPKKYVPNAVAHKAYDSLYEEYTRLHDALGRSTNSTVKKLKEIKLRALAK